MNLFHTIHVCYSSISDSMLFSIVSIYYRFFVFFDVLYFNVLCPVKYPVFYDGFLRPLYMAFGKYILYSKIGKKIKIATKSFLSNPKPHNYGPGSIESVSLSSDSHRSVAEKFERLYSKGYTCMVLGLTIDLLSG